MLPGCAGLGWFCAVVIPASARLANIETKNVVRRDMTTSVFARSAMNPARCGSISIADNAEQWR
jgi:hypothetical protein